MELVLSPASAYVAGGCIVALPTGELWAYVGKKQAKVQVGEYGDAGDQYTFLALDGVKGIDFDKPRQMEGVSDAAAERPRTSRSKK